jgi:hypothetical protein
VAAARQAARPQLRRPRALPAWCKMNMVDLILTVCLVANPGSCRDEHLYFESDGQLMHCMFLAPSEIAKWAQDHPAVRVKRWKCAFPNGHQDI